MEAKEVFISYKSEEFDDALWVKNILEDNGISCWMAPMCISGGASYATEIPNAIKDCKILVLILSQGAQESKWVPRELDQAINADKLIMPFALEDCVLKNGFEFYLSNVQRYSAYLDKEASMAKMLEDIKNYLGYAKPELAPTPVAPTEAPSPEPEQVPCESSKPVEKRKPAAPAKKPAVPAIKNSKPKKAKKAILSAVIVMAVVLAVIIGTVSLSQSEKIEFADTVFSKDEYAIHIEGKDIDSADMAALAKFDDLLVLTFDNCTFHTNDLSSITTHNLRRFAIENCNLTNEQLNSLDFEALDHLGELSLNDNKELTNLDVLSPLADSLDTLFINNTAPASLTPIKNFTKIKALSINHVGVSDLSFLSEMPYLEELYADGNNIETLDGLANTTILSKVSLNDNLLCDVSILANSADTLKLLHLDHNSISSLSALEGCTNITDFSASSNQLASAEWLSGWKAIRFLSLANNEIETIDNLLQSNSLVRIDISNNKLTGIDGITFEENSYVTANFSHNAIVSVSLDASCHFSTLALHGNPLTDAAFLTKTKGSKASLDFFDALDAKTLAETGFYNIYVTDCPTNRVVEFETASYSVKLVTSAEIDDLMAE